MLPFGVHRLKVVVDSIINRFLRVVRASRFYNLGRLLVVCVHVGLRWDRRSRFFALLCLVFLAALRHASHGSLAIRAGIKQEQDLCRQKMLRCPCCQHAT